MLERYDRLLRAHALSLRLCGGDSHGRFIPFVVPAVAAYPIQDVEQGLLLRAVGEVGAARVEVLYPARLVEGYDRWLRSAFLIIP